MEAVYVVLQILGHEPITKHTRTPPTEELPQPQLNIWGILWRKTSLLESADLLKPKLSVEKCQLQ